MCLCTLKLFFSLYMFLFSYVKHERNEQKAVDRPTFASASHCTTPRKSIAHVKISNILQNISDAAKEMMTPTVTGDTTVGTKKKLGK